MTTLNEELRELERRVSEELTDIGKRHQVWRIKAEVENKSRIRGRGERSEFTGVRFKLAAEV